MVQRHQIAPRTVLTVLQREGHEIQLVRTNRDEVSQTELDGLALVAARAFGGDATWRRSSLSEVAPLYLLIRPGQEPVVGFTTTELFMGGKALQCRTSAVDPAFQGGGLYNEIALAMFRDAANMGSDIIRVRTNKDRVKKAFSTALAKLKEDSTILGYTLPDNFKTIYLQTFEIKLQLRI